ncbi:MAG: response regulator, partial [Gemmatimonadaceae bacterium]
LEDQLRRSQRLESLGTLAAGVAHDFNNLLAIMRANAELSRLDLTDPVALDESLVAIQVACDRGRDMIRQILTFSSRLKSVREPVSMNQLLSDIRPVVRASIPATVSLVISDRTTDDVVLGDASQLHQMILNLAANAAYAMREMSRGSLTISLRNVEFPEGFAINHGAMLPIRYVCLAMTDTGTGISPDAAVRVFEPFFSTKPVGEGTGLGLAVLHGIVASHGGSVVFESRLDEGTTFEILIPAHRQADAAISFAPASQSGMVDGTQNSERVLIVDDEPELASIAARILLRHGYHVSIAATASDALGLLASRDDFDLMLTDQTMPKMSGDALCKHARALRPELAVVIMTGYGKRLSPERILECGSAGILEKPFHSAELVSAIERAISTRRRITLSRAAEVLSPPAA